MQEIEYRTIDKAEWGPGPWQDEPDKMQFQDEATGLPCLIVRGPVGALCGYVGVPDTHPWHGKDYSSCALPETCGETWCDHSPESCIDVHGGITFAGKCHESEDPSKGICHLPEPGEPENVWWFGFDCSHCGDLAPSMRSHGFSFPNDTYKSIEYVKSQIRGLAKQLASAHTGE